MRTTLNRRELLAATLGATGLAALARSSGALAQRQLEAIDFQSQLIEASFGIARFTFMTFNGVL